MGLKVLKNILYEKLVILMTIILDVFSIVSEDKFWFDMEIVQKSIRLVMQRLDLNLKIFHGFARSRPSDELMGFKGPEGAALLG